MKKLFILALVLIVAGGLFAQTAAPTVTLSGQVKYGMMVTGSDYFAGQYFDSNLRTDVKLDEFTSAVLRIGFINGNSPKNTYYGITTAPRGAGSTGNDPGALALTFNRAYVQSEIFGAMGLKAPVTNTVYLGMNYYATDLNNGVSGSEVSDVSETGVGTGFVIGNTLSIMKMVNVMFGIAPNNFTRGAGGWFATVQGNVAPVIVEVDYKEDYRATADLGKGYIAGAARFGQAFAPIRVDAYAGFKYDLLVEQSSYGIAGKVGYDTLATFWFDVFGKSANKSSTPAGYKLTYAPLADASWLDKAALRIAVTPISLLTLDVGTVLNLNAEKTAPGAQEIKGNMLNELVVGAFLNVAKTASIHFGYMMLGDSAYASWISQEMGWIGDNSGGAGTNSAPQNGGFFIETKLTF